MHCTYLHRFSFLPLLQKFSCFLFNDFVLLDDLHLKATNLGLDSCVLPLHDLIEGSPLSFHIVNIHPSGRELEPLTIQDLLTSSEYLQGMVCTMV